MKPEINNTGFGTITINNILYNHDVIIGLDGQVSKRKKKLSKAVYGTSHTLSVEEIEHVYEDGAEKLIVGTGQFGLVKLSDEAAKFLESRRCVCLLYPTPRAVKEWNSTRAASIGLFHVTC